jgi:hypothetical protein
VAKALVLMLQAGRNGRFVRFQIRNEQSWISGLELVASVLKVVVVDGLVGAAP